MCLLQPDNFALPKGFPKVGLVHGDPSFGLNLAEWDDKAPTLEAWAKWFKSLIDADWVNEKFAVFLYCSSQMIGDIQAAAKQAGCSSNTQHMVFLSDQGTGGRGRNSLHTHLAQHALLLFFDKKRPGKGGDKDEFGFDLSKVSCVLIFQQEVEPLLSMTSQYF